MAYADKPGLSPILMILMLFILAALAGVGALFVAMLGTVLGCWPAAAASSAAWPGWAPGRPAPGF